MEWDLAKSGRRVKTDDVEEDKDLKWERNSVSLGKKRADTSTILRRAASAEADSKTLFIGDRKSSVRLFGRK